MDTRTRNEVNALLIPILVGAVVILSIFLIREVTKQPEHDYQLQDDSSCAHLESSYRAGTLDFTSEQFYERNC